jgi:serine/threonine protein kinase/tetratricopeptide (TPR) repeat protein
MNSTVAFNRDSAAPDAQSDRLAVVLDRYLGELESTGIPPDLDNLVAEHPDLADELRRYVDSLRMLHQMTAGLRAPAPPTERPSVVAEPKLLGDYEILREIGRGGMGIVYEARQISLNRIVALKVLPFAAMLDERQISRFRTEAQAAAQLHHPNIVPVHAIGQERGVHYFAMQFVAGQSLECAIGALRGGTKQSPDNGAADPAQGHRTGAQRDRDTAVEADFSTKVSTRNRNYCRSVARLVIQAAEALQHAHEFGVIHRDVKPSNLLLDRDGQLWVSDFGLARIQSDSGVTFSGDVVGTVRYMSPEQAAGDSARVDARTDVYSLGATLYELLTLQPAHIGGDRQEILRNIASVDPPLPRSINSSVPFDLETITLRALAKSRDERYGTAREFADDLRRFLAGEPTMARRPTAVDRAAKWAVRHRKMVSLVAACMALVTLVSATAALMIAGAQRRTEEANAALRHNLDRVEEHYRQARQVVDRFGAGVANQLAGLPGVEPLRRQILNETLGYYREFIAHAADDPQLAAELAATQLEAATIAESLGDRSAALSHARLALEVWDRLVRESPRDERTMVERAKARNAIGLLLAASGDAEGALETYRRTINELERLGELTGGHSAKNTTVLRRLAEMHSNLGLLEGQLGRPNDARRSLATSIALLEGLAAGARDDAGLRYDLAIGFNNLSFVERQSDWSASEGSCRRAIALLEQLADEEAAPPAYRSDLAMCYNNLGAILGHRGEWQAAGDSHQRAIRLQRQLTRQAPAVVSHRRDLAASLNNLGQAQQQLGNLADAVAAFDDAQQIVSVLVDDYPDELVFRSLYGALLNNRAMVLEATQKTDEALASFEEAIEHQQLAHERAPQVAEYREFLSKHYFNYGGALRRAGRPQQAVEVALARRDLWPGHGEHLGQVALELIQAGTQLRQAPAGTASGAVKGIDGEIIKTLRAAEAAGCDMAALRRDKTIETLQTDAIWDKLTSEGVSSAP